MAAILRRTAMRKGPLGGNRRWTIVWGVLTGIKLLKRIAGDKPEILLREELEPGTALIIRNGERPVAVVSPRKVRVEK
jgi:hypothetical protein